MIRDSDLVLEKSLSHPTVRHAFFTRNGGVSEGLFASLNVGYSSGDRRELVTKNREIAARAIDASLENLVLCHQVHSANCLPVPGPWNTDNPHADAMATNVKGIVLGVFAADCAPLMFADIEAGVVAIAHAGWQGALQGICQATLQCMEELGAARNRTRMVIGPCIAQRSYEVGEELRERFLLQSYSNESFFVRSLRPGRLQFDLAAYLRKAAQDAGLSEISTIEHDTYEDSSRYFSARRALHRGEPAYGRMLALIGLT